MYNCCHRQPSFNRNQPSTHMAQNWAFLVFAILFDVIGIASMKVSSGFTKLIPSLAVFVCYTLCFVCLTMALKRLDMGIAYAVWAGVGTALMAIIGILFFGESISLIKIISIIFIMLGVIGLNLSQA